VELNAEMAATSAMPPLENEVEVAAYMIAEIALRNAGGVVPVLKKIKRTVRTVIDEFEPFP
jgi:hypothetical protein